MPTPEQAALDLKRLGINLKTAKPELRKQLLKDLREAGKPTVSDIRAGILATFPNRGGLANRMAKTSLGVRNRLSGNAAVRLQGTSRQVRGLQQMDREGTWRHPIFGQGIGINAEGKKVRVKSFGGTAFTKEERRSWKWVAVAGLEHRYISIHNRYIVVRPDHARARRTARALACPSSGEKWACHSRLKKTS